VEDFIDDLLALSPAKKYTPPKLPTLRDARDNPALLKKLPSRWQNNVKVIACIGLIGAGTITFSAYAGGLLSERPHHGGTDTPIYITRLTEQEAHAQYLEKQEPLEFKVHHGGSGGAPMYIVHLTEQEALGIIRAQLEAAGLAFGAIPPDYFVSAGWEQDIGLALFDEEKSVAIAQVSWEMNHQPFFSWGGSALAEQIAQEFAKQTKDISIGVFYNPGERIDSGSTAPTDHAIDEAKEEARPLLEEQLTGQVQAFIAWLQSQGIL